jgi:hypothetical protein
LCCFWTKGWAETRTGRKGNFPAFPLTLYDTIKLLMKKDEKCEGEYWVDFIKTSNAEIQTIKKAGNGI